ncbi:DUF2179 domain-containing protein, partial [Streptococcus pyogenes]
YLTGEGAYSGSRNKVIYVALGRRAIRELQAFLPQVDPNAFITYFDVNEVHSPAFFTLQSKYHKQRKYMSISVACEE